MEELKELIDLISKLPELAIWVLVAFWVYKVIVIGSIFGIIKLFIVKLHSWLTTDRIVRQEWKIGDLYLSVSSKLLFVEFITKELGNYPTNIQINRFIETYNKGKTNENS